MISCRLLLLFLLVAGARIPIRAQKNYQVLRFTTDNGLPSNGIKGLQWDESTGFCWIATEAGVTRYNGADFLTFSKTNTPEMFSDRMLFMIKDLQGNIYTSDETGDIFLVMQNRLQFVGRMPLDTRPSTFKLIGLAASGKMFRLSSGHPPDEFGFNFHQEQLIPINAGRILLYHLDSLYDYRESYKAPVPLTAIPPMSRLFYQNGQLLIFNRQTGFSRLDSFSQKRPITLLSANGGPGKYLKEASLFWNTGMTAPILIASGKAWQLTYRNDTLIPRLICSSVPVDALIAFALYGERSGTLFLGTNSKGVIMIREQRARSVRNEKPQIDKPVSSYSQLALSNGAVLTSQGDVLGGPPLPASRLPIPYSFNNFLLKDGDSLIWYSHGDSIYSWSALTLQTKKLFAGKGSITDGFVRSGKGLYIANAIGIGLHGSDSIEYLHRYPQADINSNVPFAMLSLEPGILAIAGCNGLFRFDINNRKLDTLLHIPGTCVRSLWLYKDYLFIGTYGKGIYIWEKGRLRAIPLDRNNYLMYAHCFLPDKLGYCWISTNKGLFRARPEDMVRAFENAGGPVYYHYYGRNDGMDITELNGGCTPCALALDDSTLSFPSMDGLVWLNPALPVTQLPHGKIYIDAFYADSQRVNISSLLQPDLPTSVRELQFHLGFPAWANKENIYIEYKLEPYSKDWTLLDIQDHPSLRFSNLPPGSYKLTFRKLNGFGEENYTYTDTAFRIQAPWYKQPWSWILGICLLSALVAAIVRLRTWQLTTRQNTLERQIAEKTRELKQKNEELEQTDHIKTRLISIISHDLVTPLKFLHLAGKSLIEKKAVLTEELQRETITEMMITSKELELLSTNILNWIKYRNEDRRLVKESFNICQLVSQLFGIFHSMAKQKDIRLINQVEQETPLYQYIEPVKIVLYNLILNALNFTSEGFIIVAATRTANDISISVRDTGVGMTQEQINNIMADHFIISSTNVDQRKGNGLGYLIIKDLLKISRGSVEIESEKGRGTRVVVTFPGQ